MTYDAKAKLKSLHEVVIRNRLEQLRKRQRDEALQAQEELLAGVAKSASRTSRDSGALIPQPDVTEQEVIPEEEMESYDRSMSPRMLDITRLSLEERQIDILTEREDRRVLVRSNQFIKFCFSEIEISVRATPCSCCFPICPQGRTAGHRN